MLLRAAYTAEHAGALSRSAQLRSWIMRLLLCVGLLMAFGAATSFTTTVYMRIALGRPPYSDFIQHLTFYALGSAAALAIVGAVNMLRPARRWLRLAIPAAYFISLILVAMVKITPLGVEWMGSTRHLSLGFVVFQPSELLKVCLVLYIAQLMCWWRRQPDEAVKPTAAPKPAPQIAVADSESGSILARRRQRALTQQAETVQQTTGHGLLAEVKSFLTPSARTGRPQWPELPRRVVAVVLVAVGLTAIQPDLGSASIIMACSLIAVVLAGVNWKQLALCGAIMLLCGLLVMACAPGHYNYAQKRIDTWLNPLEHSDSAAYQITQARGALAVGDLFGRGFLKSEQKMNRLPLSTKDFVYPVVVEELGYVGGVLVILLFLGLAYCGLRLSQLSRRPFNQVVIATLCMGVCLQGFVNIGTTIGTLPLSGLTLPFFSEGGTSIFITLCAIGLALAFAAEELRESRREEASGA